LLNILYFQTVKNRVRKMQNKDLITYGLFGIMLVVLSTLLLAPMIMPAFGYNSTTTNDTFTANVTISNAAPSVSTPSYFDDNDSSHSTIALAAGSTVNYITCNATVTDINGWQDLQSPGYVNATIWMNNSPTATTFNSATDKNTNYQNATCVMANGAGSSATATCVVAFEYEALNGTWNCTITAKDQSGSTASNSTTNTVDQLTAVSVGENSIHFGTLANDKNSTTANTTNETNLGNVKIDLQLLGTDMPCTGVGTIGVGNISFNTTSGGYDTMVINKLTTSLQSLTAFNLVQRGIGVYADTVPATNLTYWTVHVPQGVRGECTNNITVVAMVSTD
jgi:hypothetical protein